MTELKILEKDNQEGKLQKILEQAYKPRSYASLKPQPTHPITHQGGKMTELKILEKGNQEGKLKRYWNKLASLEATQV